VQIGKLTSASAGLAGGNMSKYVLLCAAIFGASLVAAQNQPNAADKQAIEVVEKFGKAFKAGDAAECMKLVTVPFNLDGREVIKDAGVLKEFIDKTCARQKQKPIDKLEIVYVKTLAELEKEKKAPSRDVSFAEVLDREMDRMVFAHAINGDRKEGVMFGVKIDKGGARIVGLFD
jgi:hypothetical protein